MDLSINETRDLALIDALYHDEWIAQGSLRDGVTLGARDHASIHYLLCHVGERVAGFFAVARLNALDWEAHVCLLKWSIPHARQFGRMAIDWLWRAGAVRITVPTVKRSTVNYCRRLGFEVEGVRRQAVSIDGARHDVTFLGLLK